MRDSPAAPERAESRTSIAFALSGDRQMSHLIDMSNNRANIAYIGEKPWHGLGQELTPGADIATWQREAGLEWVANKTPVRYENGELHAFAGKNVLFRSDTGAPLSIVSDDYHEVQPADIMVV